jgi:hypothetical protein
MSYQPPGPYPGFPQSPGGAGLPAKPPVPQTVLRAYYCMLAGAALTIVNVVIAFTERGQIRSTLEKGLPTDDPSMVNSLVTAAMVFSVALALIEIGLWLWMAFACKAGKHYARVMSSVFFGVSASSTLFGSVGFFVTSHSGTTSSAFASSDTVLGQVASWLTLAAGLAAIVLLWAKSSSAYFRPQQFFAPPYGYAGYYPGQNGPMQPPYPYPYPAQTPAPPQGQDQQDGVPPGVGG